MIFDYESTALMEAVQAFRLTERMMKRLYLIGGTMGVGKSTTCQLLKKKLHNSVFLDGDWCWDMNPFHITEETKTMVLNNIGYLLNNYLKCSVYENVIFCWVMHQQETIDEILERLETANCDVKLISLVCGQNALRKRLQEDIALGIRTSDVIERSIARLSLYDTLDTIKLDVSDISAEQAAKQIMRL